MVLSHIPSVHAEQMSYRQPQPHQENQNQGFDSMHQNKRYGKLMFDRLEYQESEHRDSTVWDVQGWYGGDINRLWVETEGEVISSNGETEIEKFDLQYGHLISPFWDFLVGMGYQAHFSSGESESRTSLLLGFQGLAPYWFQIDTNLRVSEEGDAAIDVEFEYDWRFTQKLVLQLRGETSYAFSEVDEFDVGKGLSGVTVGLRLRYHLIREFAPYIGISRQELTGDTENLVNLKSQQGEQADKIQFLVGAQFWF